MYIYQKAGWPHFVWDHTYIAAILAQVRYQQGRLLGSMEALGFKLQLQNTLQMLTEDVVQSSAIEGEILSASSVRSCVARRLHVEQAGTSHTDKHIEGIVAMVLDATQSYDQPITAERLYEWHTWLFPLKRSGFKHITVGSWRSGSVQVISSRLNREVTHFEAPPASQIPAEMEMFLDWLHTDKELDLVLKAAIAHLWFLTIHPFDDGNGRMGRALADLLLARSENTSQRFYSLSAQIQIERKSYYAILEHTQKGPLDITAWLEWFLLCLSRAIEKSLQHRKHVIDKARFWEKLAEISFNVRQRQMLDKLLDDFKGKLTVVKWAKMSKCSLETATADLDDLVRRGIVTMTTKEGHAASYSFVQPQDESA